MNTIIAATLAATLAGTPSHCDTNTPQIRAGVIYDNSHRTPLEDELPPTLLMTIGQSRRIYTLHLLAFEFNNDTNNWEVTYVSCI